ncbi:transmembrane protein 165 [Nilaparvata lugens]|uniref:transmembrane protein 165 n=1 Tax=Nilaparvata lugens TaxID=108931 RepID=UPI00193D4E21|nr:transmembrane protein 165 [Nilaparvata lugens]XP_039290208.1 transmembrane protein 165 [Nilaparvata lugens]
MAKNCPIDFKVLVMLVLVSTVVNVFSDDSLTFESKGFYQENVTSPAIFRKQGGFMRSTLASLSVTVFSELGDKTFFLAAILAMKHSRWPVFVGAMSAMILMMIVAVVFGLAASLIPRAFIQTMSTVILALFGLKMLKEGSSMRPDEGAIGFKHCQNSIENIGEKSLALTQAFTLTLLGEWGDRSQIATILLASTEDAFGVFSGGIVGHIFCTGAAVIGGSLVADKIPVKTMTSIGGVIFLIFAVSSLFIS